MLLDLRQNLFRQNPVGRDLAAEAVEQRRLAEIAGLDLQHVVAGGFLGLRCPIVEKRAHAGIGPDDLVLRDRLVEIFAGRQQEILGLAGGDLHIGGVALVILVGGADQG